MKLNIDFIFKKIKSFFYFGKTTFFKKSGSAEDYLEIFEKAKSQKYPSVDRYISKYNYTVDKNWFDDLALHTQVVKKKSKINYQHGRVLYSILCDYTSKNLDNNITIFESGTARGFSSICMSKALNDCKTKGKIFTVDIIPHNTKMYWNNIDDHLIGKVTRLELLKNWKKELQNIEFYEMKSSEFFEKNNIKRINFAFLDAVHDSENIKLEFEYVKNRQLKGDVIIFDDFDDQYITLKDYILKEVHISYNYKILESEKNRHYFIAHKK